MTAIVLLLVLLIAPGGALLKLSDSIDWRILAGACVVVWICVYVLYRTDKAQAEAGGRRTPEATLHFFELCGGWPAAFVAQRICRHKIAKRVYQINFWAIVALHQVVAFDYLHDWRLLRAGLLALSRLVPRTWVAPVE